MQTILSMRSFLGGSPLFNSPLEISFWIYSVWFILAVFLAFFIPGSVIISRLKLGTFQAVVLGTMLGMAMWIWQGFIFGFLDLRLFTYLYLLLFLGFWIKQFSHTHKTLRFRKIVSSRVNVLFGVILGLGTLIQILSVWFMGIKTQSGVFFCCGNLKDELFHISLSHQIVKNIPPLEPGMSGVIVHNYHYLSNLIVAELSRIFYLPLVSTQYQYMTIFISLFLGLTAISFAKNNNLSNKYTLWLLFFLYFGGDFIYLFLLILGKGLSFKMGSLEDGSIFLVNPPRAFAVVMFFACVSFLSLWVKKKTFYVGFLVALTVSTLIGLKVYLGLFGLFGLIVIGIFYLLKREFKMLIPIIFAGVGSLIFYLPVNTAAGGLYFTSFWLFENFVSQPQFGLIRLELARIIYQQHNSYFRLAQYELIYTCIYIFCIFGSKILGFFQTKKGLLRLPFPIHLFLIAGLTMSAVAGFFFQQTSGGSNSFNFIASIFILSSIYAALSVEYWLSKFSKPFAIGFGVLIVILTIPRVTNQTYENIRNVAQENGFILTNSQLELMNTARAVNPDSLFYIDQSFSEADFESPFVSYIIDKPVYLSGRGILKDHNVDTQKRVALLLSLFRSQDSMRVAKLLKKSNIEYIITKNPIEFSANRAGYFASEIYRNNSGRILHINQKNVEKYIKANNEQLKLYDKKII